MTAEPLAPTAEPAEVRAHSHRSLGIGELRLESGAVLPEVTLAFDTYGALSPHGDNAILVEHALTGDSHAHEWWPGLIGPGLALDTDRFFVVCANVLGGCSGSTGPTSPDPEDPEGRPYGGRFPHITVRDTVSAELRLADLLGIERWHAVLGGSMGGARALETALMAPERVARTGILAAPAHSEADQIAWGHIQLQAIRSDPATGLGIARQIAHLTYRADVELNHRFGADQQATGVPAEHAGDRYYSIQSYLDHQAAKLMRRFDAESYAVLTQALMDHDVRRGRSSDLRTALAGAGGEFLVAAVSSDRLYTPEQVRRLAEALPGSVPCETITSWAGHDGFLTESAQVAELLREFLD
ncbi:homoserine O-acetyltransferase MetX [Brevibacterium album]|uniref:homoserine O-acetyltransferase MetX n=1 Tax=Brevibacterium album TaxID=417948 RepID=UPI00040A44DE|nr:homoserine O-acetyltransferase [Brevibacterium album]